MAMGVWIPSGTGDAVKFTNGDFTIETTPEDKDYRYNSVFWDLKFKGKVVFYSDDLTAAMERAKMVKEQLSNKTVSE